MPKMPYTICIIYIRVYVETENRNAIENGESKPYQENSNLPPASVAFRVANEVATVPYGVASGRPQLPPQEPGPPARPGTLLPLTHSIIKLFIWETRRPATVHSDKLARASCWDGQGSPSDTTQPYPSPALARR